MVSDDAYLRRASRYVAMPDGVELALDVWRSAAVSDDAVQPCLLLSTRYWRGFDLAEGGLSLQPLYPLARRAAAHGYTVVNVDSRGSGASFGVRRSEWSEEELADLRATIAWIAAQPWSNGKVAAHGYSYGGNAAFLAAASGHPALTAIMPQFADFDIYRHNLFPGGVPNVWLNDNWSRLTAAQDRAVMPALADALPGVDRDAFLRHVRGPAPVDGPDGPERLAQAIAMHACNFNIRDTTRRVTCMDDAAPCNAGRPIDAVLDADRLSIRSHKRAIEAAETPIAYWAGWFDAGTAEGAFELFNSFSNPMRVVVGPWSHGRRFLQDPFAIGAPPRTIALEENFDDVLDAADRPPTDRRIDYFVLGANRWETTPAWPPAGLTTLRLHFADGRSLAPAPDAPGTDDYRVDHGVTTGTRNRWWTQINCMPLVHEDRSAADMRLLVYSSAPLVTPLEIIGAPVVHLKLSCDQPDAALFIYLEMVDPRGCVALLTEGMLRLLHRRTLPPGAARFEAEPARSYRRADAAPVVPGEAMPIAVRLLPTAIRVPAGFRLRVAIAGADADTFAAIGANAVFTLHRGTEAGSWIDLPSRPSGN